MANDKTPTSNVKNHYGAPPGSGISMPPYYRPTPSIKNRNNYFPQSEELGADEMRITFMGSNPFPPRLSQAGTCIMVECGNRAILCSPSRMLGRSIADRGWVGCLTPRRPLRRSLTSP